MADSAVIGTIKRYLDRLPSHGIHPRKAVLFGSFARDEAGEWSDIDIVVIAPEFDGEYEIEKVEDLWGARADVDIRLEPIACGEREWETDDWSPILEIARQEGIVIAA